MRRSQRRQYPLFLARALLRTAHHRPVSFRRVESIRGLHALPPAGIAHPGHRYRCRAPDRDLDPCRARCVRRSLGVGWKG